MGLGARGTSDYLPEIDAKYPGALQKQFIPLDPALWENSRYADFVERRRSLIAKSFNNQMENLLRDLAPVKQRTLVDLIAAGESAIVEYKSSLGWDDRENRVNKDLQKVIAKTVAGLLNSEGGTLVIGVSDDGDIYGIEDDLDSLGRKDRDEFFLALVQTLDNYLGTEFIPFIKTRFETNDEKTVCIVEVEASSRPVFVRDNRASEFYVRAGNSTRPLDMEAAHDFIGMHWQA